MGIEPTSSAWKAEVIPLYDTRNAVTQQATLRGGLGPAGSMAWLSGPARLWPGRVLRHAFRPRRARTVKSGGGDGLLRPSWPPPSGSRCARCESLPAIRSNPLWFEPTPDTARGAERALLAGTARAFESGGGGWIRTTEG